MSHPLSPASTEAPGAPASPETEPDPRTSLHSDAHPRAVAGTVTYLVSPICRVRPCQRAPPQTLERPTAHTTKSQGRCPIRASGHRATSVLTVPSILRAELFLCTWGATHIPHAGPSPRPPQASPPSGSLDLKGLPIYPLYPDTGPCPLRSTSNPTFSLTSSLTLLDFSAFLMS